MIRVEHREEKWKFPFVEYSPKKKKEKLPLVLQLHGAGERGNGKEDLYLVDTHGFSKLIEKEDYNCLFVMPQCPQYTFWAAKIESILEFIKQLKSEFSIDENRIYLTGLSMGGYGTWFTAMAEPELFAAIAPVCGGGMAWNASSLTMPIWAFHGAQDDVVSPCQTDEMIEKLKNSKVEVKYSRIDGVAHNVWENAYNRELLEWMLSKRK